jgi:hypothetical protein
MSIDEHGAPGGIEREVERAWEMRGAQYGDLDDLLERWAREDEA